jgi:hypothetical protein
MPPAVRWNTGWLSTRTARCYGHRHRGRPARRVWRRLLKIYAHCIDGQADAANKRIADALGSEGVPEDQDDGDEGD